MAVTKFLTPLLLMAQSAFATAAGFSSGNNFIASAVQGQVVVHCVDGNSSTYNCRDTVLDPVSYDFFMGPPGTRADEVTLSSLRADGTRRERTSDYDPVVGKSREPFNLWISTIFQRPLLFLGVNKINYTFKSRGQLVSQGAFDAVVSYGAPRECPVTHYNSSDNNDCQSQYSVCQQYFEQYQYCR